LYNEIGEVTILSRLNPGLPVREGGKSHGKQGRSHQNSSHRGDSAGMVSHPGTHLILHNPIHPTASIPV
jgi:hypothetical protein